MGIGEWRWDTLMKEIDKFKVKFERIEDKLDEILLLLKGKEEG